MCWRLPRVSFAPVPAFGAGCHPTDPLHLLVPLRAAVPVLLNLAGPAEGTAQQQAEASEEWGLPGVSSGQLLPRCYQE